MTERDARASEARAATWATIREGGRRRAGDFAIMAAFAIGATLWALEMGSRSVVFAFWINWALMGLAFVLWLVVPLRLSRSYYRVHAFERSGRVYERLGVRLFQRFLRRSGLAWLRYRARRRDGAGVVAATEGPETAHLLIFLVLVVVSAMFIRRGWWETAVWLLFFNILHNGYPVLSLRSVRARARRLFETDARHLPRMRNRTDAGANEG